MVFDPLRGRVWTANGDAGTISFVDIDGRRVVQEIALGQDIRSIALSPDGAWIAAVDRDGAAVTLVDAETRNVRRTVRVGTHPRACVWDVANPRWLYVAVEDDGAVAIVDRTLGQVVATIDVGRLPSGLAVSRSQRELYVTHRIDANVTIVDLHVRAVAQDVQLSDEVADPPIPTTPHGKPFGFESLAITSDGLDAWVPHELLASTHPFVFNETLFPAISVVDLVDRVEAQTDPNDPTGAAAGRKNLFDAIPFSDSDGQPSVFSQICAVTMHPSGTIAWALACGSEDLLTFGVTEGRATFAQRGLPCDHPTGLVLDDTGQRIFVSCDQSHTLLTFDTADGSLVQQPTLYGDPIALIAHDPVDPQLRAGRTLFFRANSSKPFRTNPSAPPLATTGNNWMSCGGCHLDGFESNNLGLFEALLPVHPKRDAQMGHVGLVDHFSTAPTPTDPTFNPHDVLVALLDQGGLAPDSTGASRADQIDPDHPTPEAVQMAQQIARVIGGNLPQGPTWLLEKGGTPNLAWDAQFCGSGSCHPNEYAAWSKSVHAHAAEDPMFLFGVGVEQGLQGPPFTRLCVGCHDPVSARSGDVSLKAKRGVTCLGCHDVDRQIRAGGNGDLEATPHDWSLDHKAWALASLEKLRQPEFCGGCHEQFVPGTGLVAIGTLDEYHASTYAPATRCVDCHMHKSNGVADHRFPGGNVYMGQLFGDDTLVNAQTANLTSGLTIVPERTAGGVRVTVRDPNVGHAFPTGVTDIREAWVEVQAKDSGGNVLATFGGPATDGSIPATVARLGADIANADGTVLLKHELTLATRVPFDVRVASGEALAFFVPLPATMPPGTASLDAVLYYRNVRTTYYRAATGDPQGHSPDIEVVRVAVP